jgi:ribosomal protection tetracycline resistance protein
MIFLNKINIGIVAHVDAGKTTVTENLLYLGGAIKKIGRVDDGNTQTDSMELEKKRGITIKSSVVSFEWKNIKINILDTPGHTDFVSEVERALSVLDGAVLVISAVEGLQAHTLMLFKVLKKLKIPTIIFINKLDRIGADYKKIIKEMKRTLSPNVIALQNVCKEGTTEVEIEKPYSKTILDNIVENLCDIDENLLEDYINGKTIGRKLIERKISIKARKAKVYPVLLGAALKGVGIEDLMDSVVKYLPYSMSDPLKPLSAVVFKIDNSNAKNKKVYVRIFDGKISLRDSILISRTNIFEKVKKINIFTNGKNVEASCIESGDIGIIYGLDDIKIGDILGVDSHKFRAVSLAQPVLKTKITAINKDKTMNLYEILSSLAQEDPLLQLHPLLLRTKSDELH